MTVENFYSLLKSSVEFFPAAEKRCDMVRGFLVLKHENVQDLTTPNWGCSACDIETPYVYSRDTVEQGAAGIIPAYPVLTAFELRTNIDGFFAGPAPGEVQQMALTVWDNFVDTKGKPCSNCDMRNIIQIWRDNQNLLLTVLDYLKGAVKAEVTSAQPEIYKSGTYNINYLKYLHKQGLINSYSVTKQEKELISVQNSNITIYRQISNAGNLIGTSVVLNYSFNLCDRPKYVFTENSFFKSNIITQCC